VLRAGYTRQQALADALAGITVGLIALPLALALGVASIPAGLATPMPAPAIGIFTAIIGGFNNSRGALLGGLLVGVCENLAAAYISPAYKDAVALIIFMVVILFKPQGLLGKKVERKV